MLKQIIGQKLSQKILPKIILSQNILAIPTLALDNIIKKELEMNPMLEEGSDNEPDAGDEIVNHEDNAQIADEEAMDSKAEEKENKQDEVDWDEYFENDTPESNYYEKNNSMEFDNGFIKEKQTSLKDNLTLQLHLAPLNELQIFIGEEIIWSLNDEGFFNDDAEDILSDLNVKKEGTKFEGHNFTMSELEESLRYVQEHLEPKGIAARNLKECLAIQIRSLSVEEALKNSALKLIENNLEDLKQKRFEKISKDLGVELSTVKEIIELIQKLNPRPGASEELNEENYIVPDIIVKKIDDDYEVFLNERYVPTLRINKIYREMYSDKKKKLDKDTKEYIVNNFNRAKWFIDAINSRRETLIKIMEAIVERQRSYFDNNETGLKPVYEKEVAEDIKMDTSTVSRAVRGKYVQTDFGIFELRSFFTTPLSSHDGEDISNTEAKRILKGLIDREDKSKPLTDEELSREMKSAGLQIARRTVAKYREAINIPVAKLRREII